jgi:hypothetical protein
MLLFALLALPSHHLAGSSATMVTVGATGADVMGTDNTAIQQAIDRVAQAGGGTVLLKAGNYTLTNSVRLASHVVLRGEGPDKTVLRKGPGVKSRLKLDADYGELVATVEDARGFVPGMGVTVVDKRNREGWVPSVRTLLRVEGPRLFFDRFLHMDYSVADAGEVSNHFPLVAGYEVEGVVVEDLTADGNRQETEYLDGCQSGAIYFFHSQKMTIRRCVARNFSGDGISTQFVEDPAIENCESYGNAGLGIHLGTGALGGVVRHNRSHNNAQDGIFLCWRVQHGIFEENESWANGRDGISIGHKDTDNEFVKNVTRENARAGVYFRDEEEINAGHRNAFRQNVMENNGRLDSPGYGVWIEGATHNLTFVANKIRETRQGPNATQRVGISIGPKADYISCERNILEGNLQHDIVDQSVGGHNRIDQAAPQRAAR